MNQSGGTDWNYTMDCWQKKKKRWDQAVYLKRSTLLMNWNRYNSFQEFPTWGSILIDSICYHSLPKLFYKILLWNFVVILQINKYFNISTIRLNFVNITKHNNDTFTTAFRGLISSIFFIMLFGMSTKKRAQNLKGWWTEKYKFAWAFDI